MNIKLPSHIFTKIYDERKTGQKITHLTKKNHLQAICSAKTFHENIEVSHDVL